MTHEQLIIFAMAAETLNFSEAARRLYLSQPTVSQQIKVLERQLGVELFERTPREVRLTSAGHALYPHALRIRQELEAADATLKSLKGVVAGPLRLGASTSIGNYYLPRILVAFKAAHPQAMPVLTIENSTRLLELLERGKLHIVLVEGPRPAIRDERLKTEAWLEDRLVLIASPRDPVALGMDVQQLAELPWVIREPGSGTREVIAAHLRARGVDLERLPIALELGSTEAIKRAVEAGAGIACVSAWSVADELAAGRLVVLHPEDWDLRRPLWLVRPRDRYLNVVGSTLLQILSTMRSPQTDGPPCISDWS